MFFAKRGVYLTGRSDFVLTRFRLVITSVFNEMGRERPRNFKKSPQALQSTEPISSRLHSGVASSMTCHLASVEGSEPRPLLPVDGLFPVGMVRLGWHLAPSAVRNRPEGN